MNIIEHIYALDTALQIKPNKAPLTPDTIKTDVINWVSATAGVIAFIFVIYGGFQYLTSGGNSEQAKKGGQTFVNAFLGLVIVVLAYGITTYVISILSNPATTP